MNKKYYKIEGDSSFLRDVSNKALVNTDNQALLAYKKGKEAKLKTDREIESLKNEMQEIKELLYKLLDK